MPDTLNVYNSFTTTGASVPQVLICDEMAGSFHEGLGDTCHSITAKSHTVGEIAQSVRSSAINYVVVRSAAQIKGPECESVFAPHLVGIGRAGVGVDNIDVAAATRNGIIVQNTPEASTESVGEHAVALAFALLKRIGPNTVATQSGKWEKKLTREISGAKVVIIAAGRIGIDAASKFKMLGAQVRAHDPFNPNTAYLYGREARGVSGRFVNKKDSSRLSREPQMPISHTPDELLAVLKEADIVSIHVPGEIREPVLGAREIAALQKGAIIVNTSRPSAIDYEALVPAIAEKDLGIGLDVLPKEGRDFSGDEVVAKLVELQKQGANVLITHHTAGNSGPAQDRIGAELAGGVVELFRDAMIRNGVNVPHTLSPRNGENPRVIVVNRDQRGAMAHITSALSAHNLHNVSFGPLPGPARAENIDVLGYDVEVNGSTPQEVAAQIVESLKRLYRDVSEARNLLIKGYVL